ncbi:MAG: methionine--tRNA ligase subunit beta [Candidatus Omnitrophica bacterium]|nr:methionine--tRNA ligase subunit beta [Candidatus Omnitrophota bacterium]
MITFEAFKAMDIRIATILVCEDHPDADKLYVLKVDTGDQKKTLVAGVKQYYKKEELINKKVVILNNLEPATIRGVRSEGMVLAAKDGGNLTIVVPEKEIKTGSYVS